MDMDFVSLSDLLTNIAMTSNAKWLSKLLKCFWNMISHYWSYYDHKIIIVPSSNEFTERIKEKRLTEYLH